MGVIRPFARALVVLLIVGLPAAPAGAQYFGRNKVEYNDFHFQILATEHFDVYFYASEEPAARIAAQLAERWYSRFSKLLNHTFDRRQPLVLYGSQAEFAQTNVVSGLLPDSVGGVTDGARRRIVMPFAPTLAETNRVLGHEIVHAFQFDIARRHGGDTSQPLWFIEGMAEYLARGSLDIDSSLWLRDAVLHDRIPMEQSGAARHFSPYLYGHAFWAYLGRTYGDDAIEKALKPGRKERRLKDRMRRATGKELDALYDEWRNHVAREYASRGASTPDRLTPWQGDSMQLGPSLSPNGTQAVFFSERDRLSIDLFLADVDTGQIIRKLATTAASAKFDSLQPLRSSGAWSPDGQWFAFPAVRHGRASLMLIDVAGTGRDRQIELASIGQVLSPTWAPDGSRIAVSALAGGATDLYLVDVASGALEQLTDDPFADLHPAWSHDGRSIAFVTERLSSDLKTMTFGRPRLAVMDVDTRQVHAIAVAAGTTELNPQWSADDREVFFIGDAGGAMNVFRITVDGALMRRITSVETGVSGITPTSPALSVSADASVIGLTMFDRGRPRLVVLDADSACAKEAALHADERARAPIFDPGNVDRALADAATGLPDPDAMRITDYASRLSLEGVGQPYLSSGGGPFGTFIRGGGALLFGDMLGERRLGAAAQVGNRLRDAAFTFRFLNQERRWNWGALAELSPTVMRYRRSEAIDHNGEQAWLRQADYFQRYELRSGVFLAYPFSRGLRIELTGGVRQAIYRRDLRSQIASQTTGRVLASDEVALTGGRPTTLAEAGAALVHDTTVFGPTGPILGSRYRLEVTPTLGQLRFTAVAADVRKYLMPVRPYTVAVRLLHNARYGPGAGDPRLLSSFLGSNYLVRGHRDDIRYCHPDVARVCGDDLLGNRLMVGNVEIRAPLWGIRSGELDYGPLPIDVFAFADSGMVWTSDHLSTRVSSIGGGLRINVGLPIEVGATRAIDGPRPRWLFDFGFRVGF